MGRRATSKAVREFAKGVVAIPGVQTCMWAENWEIQVVTTIARDEPELCNAVYEVERNILKKYPTAAISFRLIKPSATTTIWAVSGDA